MKKAVLLGILLGIVGMLILAAPMKTSKESNERLFNRVFNSL